MPRSKANSFKLFGTSINWQESYAGLILGAIVVVILGLLVANYFSKRGQQIDSGQKDSQTEEEAQAEIAPAGQYKVVAEDSLSKISQKFYGTIDLWPVLAAVNQIPNPNLIFVDSTLKIPSKQEAENVRSLSTANSYRVEKGDTLFSIAQKVYGDGSRWPILHGANGSLKLPNGNPLIFAGSTIVVPR